MRNEIDSIQNYLNDTGSNFNNKIYVSDGSNIAFEARNSKNKPQVVNLSMVMSKFDKYEINEFRIICDNSLKYCIDDKKAYSILINQNKIIETPEGTKADAFILQYAYDHDAYIISNDKFKDFYSTFSKTWIESRRISYRIIDDDIYFDKLILKGGEKCGKKGKELHPK